MPWIVVGALLLLVAAAAGGAVVSALDEKAGADGVVRAEPFRIAEAHGVSLDVEALARMGVSEAGGSSKARIACMWAASNQARRRGESIAALLLRGRLRNGTPSSSEGRFGGQNTGKYASTRLPSTPASRAEAAGILSDKTPDPTGGATQWDAPAAQNKMLGKVAGYGKTADQVAIERSKSSTVVYVAGISNIRFWRPKGVA